MWRDVRVFILICLNIMIALKILTYVFKVDKLISKCTLDLRELE